MKLCTHSRSAILQDHILLTCPLNLPKSRKDSCQCHKRLYHVPPADLRVSSCTYPNDWSGKPLPESVLNPVSVSSSVPKKRKIVSDMSDNKPNSPDINPATRPLFGVLPDGKALEVPIIGLCGGYGSGKTLAGLTICPEETIEIGVEDSGVTYNLPLKHRFSMYKEVTGKNGVTPKPIECWEWFASILEDIAKDKRKCRVLFVDPITDIQGGLVDWVKDHAADFKKSSAQYEKASGLLWADVKSHAKMLLGRVSSKCTLVFTAHMGSVWSGGAPVTGKQKAKGIDTFKELASLYVFLTREVDPKTGLQPEQPIGHICPPHGKSRLAHMVLNPATGDWESKAILPPRIEPFTWQKVRAYVQTPPNYLKLKASEKADIERLSDDDKLLLEADKVRMELEAAQLRMELAEKAEKAASRVGSGAVSTSSSVLSKATGTAPVKPTTEKTAATTTAATEKPAAVEKTAEKPAATEKPSVAETPPAENTLVPWTREACMKVVLEQIAEVKMTPEQVTASCTKRGCSTLEEMPDNQLEDLRKGLWNVITKRAIENRAKAAADEKK